MYCSKCGNRLQEGSKFCNQCATPVAPPVQQYHPNQKPMSPQQVPVAPQMTYNAAPASKKSSAGVIVLICVMIAVVVIAALVVVGVVLPALNTTTLAEQYDEQQWWFADIYYWDGEYVTRRAETDHPDVLEEVWEDVTRLELRESKKDLSEKIDDSAFMNMFIITEDGSVSYDMAVTEEGILRVYSDGETQYYTGAEKLYSQLESYMPSGDTIDLSACIPENNWGYLGISFYSLNGDDYGSRFSMDSAEIEGMIDRLGELEVRYGGGTYYGYEGDCIQLFLSDSDSEDFYDIYVYADGNADIPRGDWTYGVYDAFDLYSLLLDMMIELT